MICHLVTDTRLFGQSSATHGYTSGGTDGHNIIDKFPFTSVLRTATDVGDLTVGRYRITPVKVLSLMDLVMLLVVGQLGLQCH